MHRIKFGKFGKWIAVGVGTVTATIAVSTMTQTKTLSASSSTDSKRPGGRFQKWDYNWDK